MIDFSTLQDLTVPEGVVIQIAKDGVILWEKIDYVLTTGNAFYKTIPSAATSVVFTDAVAPTTATLTDISASGRGGVVSWLDDTTYYVSTQISGQKVIANTDSSYLFYRRNQLINITLDKLDTSNVINMFRMFSDCEGLTSLDLSNFNTSNVTDMNGMFSNCNNLTTIYASELWNTDKVTSSNSMFYDCIKLVGDIPYNSSYTNKTYATTSGGYLTYKVAPAA